MSGYNNIVRHARKDFVIHKEITKESLKKDLEKVSDWQAEQEAVVPDNVIRGIKEIENFLANTSDTETLSTLLSTLTNSLTTAIRLKYTKPSGGIPNTDLSSDVQNSLVKANSAFQLPANGIPEENLDSDVQMLLERTPDIALILAMARENSVITADTNPEWKYALVDSQNKILMGKKTDDSWYYGSDLETILDWVISTYATS